MKKFLTYFQNNLIAGTILLCNVAALPNELNPVLYDVVEHDDGVLVIDSGDEEETNDPDDDNLENPEDQEGAEEVEEELYDFDADLIIKALSPGYTFDKDKNVGEFIELQSLADTPFALAGYSLRYINTNGKISTVFTFPEGSYMTGKRLLLRYNGDKIFDREEVDIIYKSPDMAMKVGALQLWQDDEVVDEVCWSNVENMTNTEDSSCYTHFQNDNAAGTIFKTVLVRDLQEGYFTHMALDEYPIEYNTTDYGYYVEVIEEEEELEENLAPQCRGLEFSEILSYYADDKSEQFIEFFNPTGAEIVLDGCKINFKKKEYELAGTVGSGKYYAFYQSELFALTKNPTSPLTLTLIDVNGEIVDEMAYGSGQKKSTSYARIYNDDGSEEWKVTYAMTPNVENIYQKYRSCEEGKIINEATGNCVKVSLTNTAEKTLAPCPEGQYRNPLTNRCKKITTTTSTLKECAEGYERNPETNRCRKITTPNEGADYALVPSTHSDKTVFIGIGVVAIIISLGLIYVGLQFRHEIARTARVASQRCKNMLKKWRKK